ncbi:ACR3 family arsenite efflux transporter [Corynebacterium zhongnanshanii]|uniref:ACR3 family arsenite efflux transporter n=1 Tax=Corynebacterium zhongnanshanii TaxID=2768834 RepID=A0ABQ6VBM5_9CORY|nr:ACR3 family arsenite efflux transporter [Corynebacterium zhongnanshanii]KAB3519141.1 ACR3 family arsenite efflux transporter [Corynebacterium zhongnanshanii]
MSQGDQHNAPTSSPPQPHASQPLDSQPHPPQLSTLDKFLPLWILLAMTAGILLSTYAPSVPHALESVTIGGTSLPIAIGLLVMMYPPLAKVRYDKAAKIAADKRLMTLSLALNWLFGPLFMFALAWLFLPQDPELRTGLIIVGLARCIAMVLVWTDLSCADRELTAVLVAINAVFQVLMFGVLGWFYLQVLPSWLGLETTSAKFSFLAIAASVLIFLGIPLLAGVASRIIGERTKGREFYENVVIPKISPLALIGLLYTIVLLFSLQGQQLVAQPWTVVRVAAPLLIYFVVMFGVSLWASKAVGLNYAQSTSVAFTAAGNNFELAIAVSIGTFGASSAQALAGTIGPLVEIPVLVGLVYVVLWLGPKLFTSDATAPHSPAPPQRQPRRRHSSPARGS